MAIGPTDKPTSKNAKRDLDRSVGSETQVDLGDDLLDKTATEFSVAGRARFIDRPALERAQAAKAAENAGARKKEDVEGEPSVAEKIHDRVQSARILFSEGLIDEAKKTARQVLIDDPSNAFASQLLGEIHKLELKQIFGGGSARRNVFAPKSEEPGEDLSKIDAAGILQRLDQDLTLGFFDAEGAESPIAQLSLFSDPEEMQRFGDRVDRDMRDTSLTDRLDVGIGFLEMGLYDLAARQFRQVYRRARPSMELLLSSAALLAYVLVLSGHPFDASLVIQPVLKEPDVALKDKVELFYLMGRAQEMLRKPQLAAEWYVQVREHDPFYRDIEERLRRIDRQETK